MVNWFYLCRSILYILVVKQYEFSSQGQITRNQVCSVQPDSSSKPTTTCRLCSKCSPGQFIKQHCSVSKDTVCAMCPPGTYSTKENSENCNQCSRCHDKVHVSMCTKSRDTVCSCSVDTFYNRGTCVACSLCTPGTYASTQCSTASDTICSPCRPGSFTSNTNSAKYCQACSRCYRNHVLFETCTPIHNSRCGGCQEGYYLEENTGDCEKCSYCFPETPGYTFQVEACLQVADDLNWTCMPVVRPPRLKYAGRAFVETTHQIDTPIPTIGSNTNSTLLSNTDERDILMIILIPLVLVVCAVVLYISFIRKTRTSEIWDVDQFKRKLYLIPMVFVCCLRRRFATSKNVGNQRLIHKDNERFNDSDEEQSLEDPGLGRTLVDEIKSSSCQAEHVESEQVDTKTDGSSSHQITEQHSECIVVHDNSSHVQERIQHDSLTEHNPPLQFMDGLYIV